MTAVGHDRKATTAATNGRSRRGNRSFKATLRRRQGSADCGPSPFSVIPLGPTGSRSRLPRREEFRSSTDSVARPLRDPHRDVGSALFYMYGEDAETEPLLRRTPQGRIPG